MITMAALAVGLFSTSAAARDGDAVERGRFATVGECEAEFHRLYAGGNVRDGWCEYQPGAKPYRLMVTYVTYYV